MIHFFKMTRVAMAALAMIGLVACGSSEANLVNGTLPRANSSQALDTAFDNYLAAVQAAIEGCSIDIQTDY